MLAGVGGSRNRVLSDAQKEIVKKVVTRGGEESLVMDYEGYSMA